MFLPTLRFLAIASRLSKARLAEIRDWPMPKNFLQLRDGQFFLQEQ